jgi:heterodisulfide reductase subunit A
MDIPESVTTAGAAAAAASSLLTTAHRAWGLRAQLPPSRTEDFPPRIGVFLCHCGTNIAKTIDLAKLAAAAARLPGVEHVEANLFSCAVESTGRMRDTIQNLGLNRVVVAACSPRTHEQVFREVLAGVGLNPGFFTMANIREQCAWVHHGPGAAGQGGIGGYGRAAGGEACAHPSRAFGDSRALVGRVASMSAALTLADRVFIPAW